MKTSGSGNRFTAQEALRSIPTPEGGRSASVFKHGTLEVKISAPRGTNQQSPHPQDEVYVILSGRGHLRCGDDLETFGPGDVLFVPAGVHHRFEDFSDDLTVWVIFYGPQGGEEQA